MYQSEQIDELAKALAPAQGELNPALKNAQNPHLKNRYADIAAIWDAVREVLPKHGLAVTQTMQPREDGKACVRTTLMHSSGQWISGECALPVSKQDPQGYGSAITYARRYSLSAILGVVSEEDDDGHSAGQGNNPPPQPPRQTPRQTPQPPAKQPPRSPAKNTPPPFDMPGATSRINAAASLEELKAVYASLADDAKASGNVAALNKATNVRKAELASAPADETSLMSDGQRKMIMSYYGGISRQERLDDMTTFLGRKVETFSNLTVAEAHSFIDAISQDRPEAANG